MGRKCPLCGSMNTARIQYGLPAFSEKLIKDIDEGKVKLGGCCITDYDPTRHCNDCHEDFGYPPAIFSEEGQIIGFYDVFATSVQFSIGGFFEGYDDVTITANENSAVVESSHIPNEDDKVVKCEIPLDDWRKIIDKLYHKMYLCDWEHDYIDPDVCDGTQWSLTIGLYDGSEEVYYGDNAFPPYMTQLENLFKKYYVTSK